MGKMLSFKEIKSKKYGRLTVISEVTPKDYGYRKRRRVNCVCDCGNKVILVLNNIRIGTTKSCGCLLTEINIAKNYKHGMTLSPEYQAWRSMFKRCNDQNSENYKYYGGRGITICKRWEKFECFYKDIGDKPTQKHSLDRIDNNGNYYKNNCKWSTPKEQTSNRRTTIFIEYKGLKLTIAEWSFKLNIKYTTIYSRHKKGWEIKRILTK